MTPRLFLQVLGLEVRTRLSYRIDFWLNAIVGFLCQFGLVYFVWDAMYAESGRDEIGGLEQRQMVLYYLTVIVLGRMVGGRDLEGNIATDVYEGGLNRYLVFPVGYLPFKYAQAVGRMIPAAVPFVVLGALSFALMDLPTEGRPTLAGAAMALPALVLANLLHFLISFPIQLVSFWADNVWSLDVAKRFAVTFLGGMMIPLSVFPETFQRLLERLPFQYLFWFPSQVLLGRVTVREWAVGLGVALLWCVPLALVGRLVWHRGQLQYTGVGI